MLYAKSQITIKEGWLPGDLVNARIYLASPYTHTDKAVMEERYNATLVAFHFFLRHRLTIYSPIVHSHAAAAMGGLPVDFKFWGKHCLSFLEHWATEIWTLQIPGVEESAGVKAELAFCRELPHCINKRAVYFSEDYFQQI